MENDIERPGGLPMNEAVPSSPSVGIPDAAFDPCSPYDEFRLPEWCVGRVPVLERHHAVHNETLRTMVERLDAVGEREAADTIVWLMWWRTISDNRAQFMCEQWLSAQGMSASGQDAQQLEAKPASPVHAPNGEQSNAG